MSAARDVLALSRLYLAEGDGLVAVLKVYIDESGTHDGSPVVAVGAYLGRPGVWRDWTKLWNARKRPIKVFHASDCQNFRGEFRDWDKERRDPYVAALLPVIPAHNIAGVVVAINMNDFREAMAGRNDLMEMLGSPYASCLQWAITHVMQMIAEIGSRDRIAFVHEENHMQGEAMKAFEWVKRFHNPQGNVVSLTFGTKQDYVPLQAADILAFEGGKFLRDPSRPRRAWVALDRKKNVSALCVMAAIISRSLFRHWSRRRGNNALECLVKILRVLGRVNFLGHVLEPFDALGVAYLL